MCKEELLEGLKAKQLVRDISVRSQEVGDIFEGEWELMAEINAIEEATREATYIIEEAKEAKKVKWATTVQVKVFFDPNTEEIDQNYEHQEDYEITQYLKDHQQSKGKKMRLK